MGVLIPNFEDSEECGSVGPAFFRVSVEFPLLRRSEQSALRQALKQEDGEALRVLLKGIVADNPPVDERTEALIDHVVRLDGELKRKVTRHHRFPWRLADGKDNPKWEKQRGRKE